MTPLKKHLRSQQRYFMNCFLQVLVTELTSSVHHPHFSETWMHSPHDCAFALMHMLPSEREKLLWASANKTFSISSLIRTSCCLTEKKKPHPSLEKWVMMGNVSGSGPTDEVTLERRKIKQIFNVFSSFPCFFTPESNGSLAEYYFLLK